MATAFFLQQTDGTLRRGSYSLLAGEVGDFISFPDQAPLALMVAVSNVTITPTVTVEVSADGTNWFTARDVQGADAILTAPGFVEISTAALYLRVKTAGGDADVDVVARG